MRGPVRRSGYLDRWNVDKGGGEKDNGNRHVAEAMARHKFEGSRQGARTRTTGADKDTRRGIKLAGIISVSPIPPFASSFTVNNCGHLTLHNGLDFVFLLSSVCCGDRIADGKTNVL